MNNKSVLIIEDDNWLAQQYERILVSAGYIVTITNHTLAAIHAIDKNHPDAIILDVLLTGSTAFTLLHELQSYSDTGSIPIILCTNLADELTINDLGSYGVKLILDKTKMKPDDLVSSLRSVLS